MPSSTHTALGYDWWIALSGDNGSRCLLARATHSPITGRHSVYVFVCVDAHSHVCAVKDLGDYRAATVLWVHLHPVSKTTPRAPATKICQLLHTHICSKEMETGTIVLPATAPSAQ